MHLRLWFTALALVLASTNLNAQSQSEMNREAAEEADAADKELNQVYKELMATLDDEGKALLKASQRAWIAYRDAECAFAADEVRGGSMAPLLYSTQMTALTDERTAVLLERLEGVEEPADAEPEGAANTRAAAKQFYNAYVKHDRKAAAKVASEKVLAQLVWDPKAGSSEGLQLIDEKNIYYEGGSIGLKTRQNSAGRWFIHAIEVRAD
jgi:uncharacterized protein YecT (DUF1311 family)